jgi:DUF3047 family protein
VIRAAALALAPLAAAAVSLEGGTIASFSAATPGVAMPHAWRVVTVPRVHPPDFTLVQEDGRTVLRVRSHHAAGSLAHSLDADTRETPMLAWRWKVDHVLEKARFGTKEGDDYAARLYVSFDVPLESLSFGERAMVRLARMVYGDEVPTAAICYVWDNTQALGTSAWNPYAEGRLRMVVLRNSATRGGEWVDESRDIEADFQAAFGATWKKPIPRVNGVAVSSDTDQTGESVTAWFGDLRLEKRR